MDMQGKSTFQNISAQDHVRQHVGHVFNHNYYDSKEENSERRGADKLLDHLAFSDMKLRRANIEGSYAETYKWVFTDPHCGFPNWLANDERLFWITGKAGSGKSTLMKFITGSPATHRRLKKWAGEHHFVVTEFYFWYLGSPLQKSIEGLLRSVLYQILSRCRHLIPQACSSRWRQHSSHEIHPTLEPWTEEELYRMMDEIISADSIQPNARSVDQSPDPPHNLGLDHQRRFCFFIDGLDEYNGDQVRLVKYIKKLALLPSFKICISSRPWNIFTQAFAYDKIMLRLEEFTRPDIENYVSGNIKSTLSDFNYTHDVDSTKEPSYLNPELAPSDSDEVHQVIQKVVDKAGGVFLWVRLVVDSLVRGIAEGDSIRWLSKRVDKFPPDLYDFFKTILSRVEDVYARDTARVMLFAQYLADDDFSINAGPFSSHVLTYWLLRLGEDDLLAVLDRDIDHVSRPMFMAMVNETRMFIGACCKDLLQVYRHDAESIPDHFISSIDPPVYHSWISRYRVEFLHRTVYEFICSDYIQSLLTKHEMPFVKERRFWARLCMTRLKIMPTVETDSDCLCKYFYSQASHICFASTDFQDNNTMENLIDELEKLLLLWLKHPCGIDCDDHRGSSFDAHNVYTTLAAYQRYEILRFLAATDYWRPCDDKNPNTEGLLLPAILGLSSRSQFPLAEIDSGILSMVLERGASPNERFEKLSAHGPITTVWEVFIARWGQERRRDPPYITGMSVGGDIVRRAETHVQWIADTLIQYGADPKVLEPEML